MRVGHKSAPANVFEAAKMGKQRTLNLQDSKDKTVSHEQNMDNSCEKMREDRKSINFHLLKHQREVRNVYMWLA